MGWGELRLPLHTAKELDVPLLPLKLVKLKVTPQGSLDPEICRLQSRPGLNADQVEDVGFLEESPQILGALPGAGPHPSIFLLGAEAGLAKSPLPSWTLLSAGRTAPASSPSRKTDWKGGGRPCRGVPFLGLTLCPAQARATACPLPGLRPWKPPSAPSKEVPGHLHQPLAPTKPGLCLSQVPSLPPFLAGLPGVPGTWQVAGVEGGPLDKGKAALWAGWAETALIWPWALGLLLQVPLNIGPLF